MTLCVNENSGTVSYTCCVCDEIVEDPFDAFCEEHGDDPDLWVGDEFICPCCGAELEVENVTGYDE